jgi:hypothetical protein
MEEYVVGTEVVFLDDTNERFGTIEYINGDRVHICGLDGSLYLTDVQWIMYPLIYPAILIDVNAP